MADGTFLFWQVGSTSSAGSSVGCVPVGVAPPQVTLRYTDARLRLARVRTAHICSSLAQAELGAAVSLFPPGTVVLQHMGQVT